MAIKIPKFSIPRPSINKPKLDFGTKTCHLATLQLCNIILVFSFLENKFVEKNRKADVTAFVVCEQCDQISL
jgi:hypothetical protein